MAMAQALIVTIYVCHLVWTVVQVAGAERRRQPGTRVRAWTTPLLDLARWATVACCIWQTLNRESFNLLITGVGVLALIGVTLAKRHVINCLQPFWSRHIEIRPGHRLVTEGPYALVRHPHYALNVVELAVLPIIGNVWAAEVCAAVFAVIAYGIRIPVEERALADAFGEQYRSYRARVPCVLPSRALRPQLGSFHKLPRATRGDAMAPNDFCVTSEDWIQKFCSPSGKEETFVKQVLAPLSKNLLTEIVPNDGDPPPVCYVAYQSRGDRLQGHYYCMDGSVLKEESDVDEYGRSEKFRIVLAKFSLTKAMDWAIEREGWACIFEFKKAPGNGNHKSVFTREFELGEPWCGVKVSKCSLSYSQTSELWSDTPSELKTLLKAYEAYEKGQKFADFKEYLNALVEFFKAGHQCLTLVPLWIGHKNHVLAMGILWFQTQQELQKDQVQKAMNMAVSVLAPIRIAEEVEEQYEHNFRSVAGALIARNMSHNLGSHVLAGLSADSICDPVEAASLRNSGKAGPCKRSQNASTLLKYLQQRMDFVTTAVVDWPGWRQPMLFYADLISGFLEQELLLDRLVADEGFGKIGGERSLAFSIQGPYDESPVSGEDLLEGKAQYKDFLVSVPGGFVGRHAFYSLLENAVRNSAKHNRKNVIRLEVHVRVHDTESQAGSLDPAHYTVEFWDNLSEDLDGGKKKKIQEFIDKPIVDRVSGERDPEHWGLHEMALCSAFLDFDGSSRQHLVRPPLKAIHHIDSKAWLGYQFYLRRATLVAVDDTSVRETQTMVRTGLRCITVHHEPDGRHSGTSLTAAFRETSPGLLYASGALLNQLNESTYAPRMPFRVLVVSQETNQKARSNLAFGYAVQPIKLKSSDKEEECQKQVLEYYWSWLRQFAEHRLGSGFHLHLLITSTQHQAGNLCGWEQIAERARKWGLCSIYVVYQGDTTIEELIPGTLHPGSLCSSTKIPNGGDWLLFDSHGRMIPEKVPPREQRRFYQMTGNRNQTLKRYLENPPSDWLGELFLIQLLESCLLRILVIDERILKHTMAAKGSTIDDNRLAELEDAGIFVSAFFNVNGVDLPLLEGADLKTSGGDPAISVKADGSISGISVLSGYSPNVREVKTTDCDVAVIHWSQVTRLQELHGVKPNTFLMSLNQYARRVVLTSGRGRPLDRAAAQFPFLEYAVLDQYVVRELAKAPLASALMSVM